jgi:hypothetical protein
LRKAENRRKGGKVERSMRLGVFMVIKFQVVVFWVVMMCSDVVGRIPVFWRTMLPPSLGHFILKMEAA